MKKLDVYYEENPNFGEQDFCEWVQLTKSVRQLMDTSTKLRAEKAQLKELTRKVQALEAELTKHAGHRPVSSFSDFNPDHIARTSPFCPVMGELSPLATPMKMFFDGDKVVGEVTFDDLYQGPPNCVHGGVVAQTYDVLLAWANMVNKVAGPTAYITIRYHQLTPLHKPLRFEAKLDRQDGRKIFTNGVCYYDGEIVTEAEGLFIHTTEHMYKVESAR